MYENNKDIGWKKKENNSSNGSYDDSLIKNQINVLDKKIEDKQDELISGSNIKTINGQDILGRGNITINEGEDVDLSVFATKDELNNKADIKDIPTKVSQLENDNSYITTVPSEYITESELNNKGYATESYVNDKVANIQLEGGNVNGSVISNIFKGKVANFLGDSNTQANTSWRSKTYPEWVKEILGLSVINNYGKSGSAITSTSETASQDTSSFVYRYNQMDTRADLIIVMGGVNDIGNNSELGKFGDTSITTFYGAMEALCDGLLTKYPGKTIIFVTCIDHRNPYMMNTNTTGYTAFDFSNAMKIVCAKYSIPVFDAYSCSGIYAGNSANSAIYLNSDKLHLNDAGCELMGKKIANFVLFGALNTVVFLGDNTGGDNTGGDNTGGDNTGGDTGGDTGATQYVISNKQVTNTSYVASGSKYTLAGLISAADINNGDVLTVKYEFSNVINIQGNVQVNHAFWSDVDELGKGLSGSNLASTSTWSGDCNSGTGTITINKENTGRPYLIFAVALNVVDKTQPCGYVIDSLSISKNGVNLEILKIGAAFVAENTTITDI